MDRNFFETQLDYITYNTPNLWRERERERERRIHYIYMPVIVCGTAVALTGRWTYMSQLSIVE